MKHKAWEHEKLTRKKAFSPAPIPSDNFLAGKSPVENYVISLAPCLALSLSLVVVIAVIAAVIIRLEI